MRNDDLRELADDLEMSGLDEQGKELVRKTLRHFAARHGMSCFDREEQIAFVQHLRMIGEETAVIRERLMARFGIGKSTAYNRVTEALQVQLSKKPGLFWTAEECNEGGNRYGG